MTTKVIPFESQPSKYSDAWRGRYGRTLRDDEIRLVQAFRGLTTEQHGAVLTLLSHLVTDNCRAGIQAAKQPSIAELRLFFAEDGGR
jgi:hypothetical protein